MNSQNLEEILVSNSTNFGFLKKTIIFLRKNNIRIPEVILTTGLNLIENYKAKLGDECIFYESYAHSKISLCLSKFSLLLWKLNSSK